MVDQARRLIWRHVVVVVEAGTIAEMVLMVIAQPVSFAARKGTLCCTATRGSSRPSPGLSRTRRRPQQPLHKASTRIGTPTPELPIT
jgi:hypothetical protein